MSAERDDPSALVVNGICTSNARGARLHASSSQTRIGRLELRVQDVNTDVEATCDIPLRPRTNVPLVPVLATHAARKSDAVASYAGRGDIVAHDGSGFGVITPSHVT